MKTYLVALEIVSSTKNRQQISRKVGVKSNCPNLTNKEKKTLEKSLPSAFSERAVTRWRFESERPQVEDLEKHFKFIADNFPLNRLICNSADNEWEVSLDIAIFHDTYTCSVRLPTHWLNFFNPFISQIQINTYPTSNTKSKRRQLRKSSKKT